MHDVRLQEYRCVATGNDLMSVGRNANFPKAENVLKLMDQRQRHRLTQIRNPILSRHKMK